MRFGTTKTWAITAGAATVALGGYSIGSQANDGVATGQSSGSPPKVKFAGRGAGAPMLDDLAGRLGVDRQKLEDALAAIRGKQQPRVTKPRDDFVAALAAKLGIDQAKVEKALEARRPERPGRPGERHDKMRPQGGERHFHGGERHFRTGPGGPAKPGRPGGPAGPDIAGLAKDLGVDEAKLQAALDELRKDEEPALEAKRNEFAKQLADQLGIDVAKVKAALPDPPTPRFRAAP